MNALLEKAHLLPLKYRRSSEALIPSRMCEARRDIWARTRVI